ncbi:dihydropteroate synthase [Pigmentibacter sp. JX0631]|uniref:dihydropteroate synthase n=1 Tax=Pigmentibacter sp. JX0631 TaxID=2976982 RepID=UPI002468355A|nr:dihydropteroate synthase [Pigmentibacter sp. JX0631]WGL58540.1 dihydropteroate synthase [Pigmentibacter sp. JX0631]
MNKSDEKLKNLCIQNQHIWMGIINITPDSFSDGGIYFNVEAAIKRAMQLVEHGAKILDIGGVSTRPYAETISTNEELDRLYPIVSKLKKNIPDDVLISLDSFNPNVTYTLAQENLIDIINDQFSGRITGLISSNNETRNISNAEIAASFNLGYVIMHMQGKPTNMQNAPKYQDCSEEVILFLQERMIYAERCGVKEIILDPGIGFGKTVEHNLELLSPTFINKLLDLNKNILVGLSRKWFIGQLHKELDIPNKRDYISKDYEFKCIANGVKIIRSHVMPSELTYK